jgi:acetyl esterase/lipase
MKIQTLTTLAFCVASLCASAQNRFEDYTPRPIHEGVPTEKSAQVFRQTDRDGNSQSVMYMKDIKYEMRDGVDLTLQILMPMTDNRSPKPCIVYVPGSAWMKQDVYGSLLKMSEFAKRGFVIALVEYRHTGIAIFPAQLIDCKNAVRFMRKNARRMGVDVNNIFIWGDSSGGHLSLFTGITEEMAEFDDPDDASVSCKVNAVVAYYPPTDLTAIRMVPDAINKGEADSPEGLLIGGKAIADYPEPARKASPYYYVSKDRPVPPIFLAVGTQDRILPFEQTDIMANVLADNGKTFEYYVLPGADHGSWEFWTPAMYDKVEAFLRKYMK